MQIHGRICHSPRQLMSHDTSLHYQSRCQSRGASRYEGACGFFIWQCLSLSCNSPSSNIVRWKCSWDNPPSLDSNTVPQTIWDSAVGSSRLLGKYICLGWWAICNVTLSWWGKVSVLFCKLPVGGPPQISKWHCEKNGQYWKSPIKWQLLFPKKLNKDWSVVYSEV